MAGKKSPEEQLKARKQQLRAKANQEARKERTRKLIQIGAIIEKYFGVETVDEAELMAQMFSEPIKKRVAELRNVNVIQD